MKREEKKLPKATAKRLPLYLRYLKMLEQDGIHRIKSHNFSEVTQVPSATIRRDFSYIGELGRSGYGYEVSYLIEVLSKFLEIGQRKNIALIGCGNLGTALMNNNFRRDGNLEIVCAFDSDESRIGQTIRGTKVLDIRDFKQYVDEQQLALVISTVPSEYAQEAIDIVVKSGIKSILNFAPERVKVPSGVHVQYIDLTSEVQTLLLYDKALEEVK